MSSRALRKLQGQAHQELTDVIGSSDPEEEDNQIEQTTTKKKKKVKTPINPFALVCCVFITVLQSGVCFNSTPRV